MRDFSAEITPVILTRNEDVNIGRTLAQLAWANEVVVVDSVSADNTAAIAKSFANVRLIERPFDDLASQWSFATAQAKTPWVLSLDADYFVPAAFASELRDLDPPPSVNAYSADFTYAVHGRPLRASLYPARPVLFRRDRVSFVMDGHTHRARIEGDVRPLREKIIHDDRKPFSRFVQRQRIYMRDEAAKIRRGEDLNFAGRIRKLRVIAPFAVVFHSLFVKGLILDGIPGLRYAWERFVAEVILSIELMKPVSRPRSSP
ncbi:MAG TPA: glycosyltransferase [Thermoanaerobaculia bacterium]|jgi:glycosyltransferase involved in cell wall biosynthesis|nr:glycosyltransferase [Thermoanaerobaculia bacterium]